MSLLTSWTRFGQAIAHYPSESLASFFGDEEARSELKRRGVEAPTTQDLVSDSGFWFDWEKPAATLDFTTRALGLWGREPVIECALACAALQIEHEPERDDELRSLRDEVWHALQSVTLDSAGKVPAGLKRVLERCDKAYRPFEDGDDPKGSHVWYALGAPWFAAETLAQDWALQAYDGEGPPQGTKSWVWRNSAWPRRAVDAAVHWSSEETVRERLKATALRSIGSQSRT